MNFGTYLLGVKVVIWNMFSSIKFHPNRVKRMQSLRNIKIRTSNFSEMLTINIKLQLIKILQFSVFERIS